MELTEERPYAAVAQGWQVWHLHALGRVFRPGVRLERHLVRQPYLHNAGFVREETPRSHLWSSGKVRLQGLYPHVYGRKVQRRRMGGLVSKGWRTLCRAEERRVGKECRS